MTSLNTSTMIVKGRENNSSVTIFRDFTADMSSDELKEMANNNNNYGRRIENTRFRIVKIALEKPFQRKRWTCYDYYDEDINPRFSTNLDSVRNEFKRNAAGIPPLQQTNDNSSKDEKSSPMCVDLVTESQPGAENSNRKKKLPYDVAEDKMDFEVLAKKLRMQQQSQIKQKLPEVTVVNPHQRVAEASPFDIQTFAKKLLAQNEAREKAAGQEQRVQNPPLVKDLNATRKVSRFQIVRV